MCEDFFNVAPSSTKSKDEDDDEIDVIHDD